MTKYHIKSKEAVEAMVKAYQENRLGFQNGYTECMYNYGDSNICCIAGAALPQELWKALGELSNTHNEDDIELLLYLHKVKITAPFLNKLIHIQKLHDACCNSYNTDEEELEFTKALKDLARTYKVPFKA